MSSIGTTCAYPPPVPPPLIPNTGPIEGSRRQSITSLPIFPMPCVREIEVVVLPSPAFVGVIAVVMIELAVGPVGQPVEDRQVDLRAETPNCSSSSSEDPGVRGDLGDGPELRFLRDLQSALHGLASCRIVSGLSRVRIPRPSRGVSASRPWRIHVGAILGRVDIPSFLRMYPPFDELDDERLAEVVAIRTSSSSPRGGDPAPGGRAERVPLRRPDGVGRGRGRGRSSTDSTGRARSSASSRCSPGEPAVHGPGRTRTRSAT